MKPALALLFALFLPLCLKGREVMVVNGFDGGMMLHTGYVCGSFPQLELPVSGAPFGVGGVVRLHLGKHWRIGGEGYVSTLKLLRNGSYVKFGWGGILCDFYWRFGHFIPYGGLSVGGGANTNLIVAGEKTGDWKPVENTYFNSTAFFALTPFIGCDWVVTEAFHLTLKADWLNCIGAGSRIPTGPRLYFGFIFHH